MAAEIDARECVRRNGESFSAWTDRHPEASDVLVAAALEGWFYGYAAALGVPLRTLHAAPREVLVRGS